MRSLADVLDSGPDLSDPPEPAEDLRLLEELERASRALAERLKHEPGLSRAAAQLFCKTSTQAKLFEEFSQADATTAQRFGGTVAYASDEPSSDPGNRPARMISRGPGGVIMMGAAVTDVTDVLIIDVPRARVYVYYGRTCHIRH